MFSRVRSVALKMQCSPSSPRAPPWARVALPLWQVRPSDLKTHAVRLSNTRRTKAATDNQKIGKIWEYHVYFRTTLKSRASGLLSLLRR
jgi:hypothetical protein